MSIGPTFSPQELVLQCKKGNPQAYKQLYDQYAPQMMGLCMRYARSKEEAQDLLHDGFVRVLTNVKKISDDSVMGAWVHKVILNTCINHVNRRAQTFVDITAIEGALVSSENGFDEYDAQYLVSVVQGLPDKYRLVFNMREVDGCSYEEIAAQLHMEQSSVRSLLARARNMIIEKLKQDER